MYVDELPCTVSIPRLGVIANHHIPQRKNNRLLLGGAALSPAQLGAVGSSSSEISSPSANAAGLSQSQLPPQSRSHTDEPEWVRDLKEMLRETKAAKSEPHGEAVKKEQVRALLTDVAEAEGHPQWAKDLLNILGSGSRASSAAHGQNAGITLRAGTGVRLRMRQKGDQQADPGDQHATPQQATPQQATPEHVPPEQVPRTGGKKSVAEYEAAAMEAMLKVQGKRKLEAAERKSDKDRIEGLKLTDADNESEPTRKRPSAGK